MTKTNDLELAEWAKGLTAKMTELVSLARSGQLNNVLYSGTIKIPTEGYKSLDFSVPFASVAVQASATSGDVTVHSAGPENTAPIEGVGLITVAPDGFVCIPLTGNQLTIYGAAGDLVYVAVLSKPVPPSAA